MDRHVHVIVAVEYEPDAKGAERSLGWLVPELVDAGLTITEDNRNVRKWAGVIDGDTYERFADRWQLANKADHRNLMQTEYGHLAARCYTWDGMEWELSGCSPIVWMSLEVSEPIEAELCLDERDLPLVYGG